MSEHDGELSERVDALAAWIKELEAQLRASTSVADSKSLKELAKALEAWNKHDPKLEKRLTERVDVLADRFATLAGTVNTTAASLAGKDGEIANLRRALEEGNARIESVVGDLRQVGTGADVAELRRAVAELSSERRGHSGDPRVDGISGELDVLAQRLDTLSKTVSTTASGLAGREGELVTLRARVDETEARAGSVVDELRRSLEELARQVYELGESSGDSRNTARFEGYVGDLARQIQELVGSVDIVSTRVAEAAESIAANEDEVASLGARFYEAGERVDTMILELQEAVASLPATGPIDGETEERLADLGRRLDAMTDHVAGLETSLTTQLTTHRRESETSAAAVSELGRRFDEASRRVDTMILELQDAFRSLPTSGAVDGEVEESLAALGRQLDGMTAHVADLEASLTAQLEAHWRESASSAAEHDHVVAELSTKLEELERDRDSTLAEVGRTTEAWAGERAWVRDQLDQLAAAVEDQRTDDTLGPRLQELAARVDAIERGQAAVGAEIARVATAWDEERAELKGEVEALATTVGSLPTIDRLPAHEPNEQTEELLRELSSRLDSMEHERSQVAAEIAQSQELWNTKISSLGAQLDEVARSSPDSSPAADPRIAERLEELALRLEAIERRPPATADASLGTPAMTEELHDLRVLMNGLRMRLTSSEKELALLSSQEDVVSRLDDISLRLASLERSTSSFAPAPRAGDGRFRVELRGLEQKMEQLEASAQENRDAVLMQFERLASRLQWRLQQLELESADAGHSTKATPAPLGQVVPLRGEG